MTGVEGNDWSGVSMGEDWEEDHWEPKSATASLPDSMGDGNGTIRFGLTLKSKS